MDSSNSDQASTHQARGLEISVSHFVSEPMLDIDSATLQLSLPEDAVQPSGINVDSFNPQSWEDIERFESLNEFESNGDSILSLRQIDTPYLNDGNNFQEPGIDNFPSDVSKDNRLVQVPRNAKTKSLVFTEELESEISNKENPDYPENLENDTTSSVRSFAEDGNEASSSKLVVPSSHEFETPEEASNARQQLDGILKSLQAHPEYPENFNNYKVCRVIAPGVKECLILETGEQVKCDKRQKLQAAEEGSKKPARHSERRPPFAEAAVGATRAATTASPPTPPPLPSPPPPPPPPPPPDVPQPPPNTDTMPRTYTMESEFTNVSPASTSSEKENIDFEAYTSPQPRKKTRIVENGPAPSPLREKQIKENSSDEAMPDQDKLSKKVFKITKPHVEDSAAYFGNLKLGRGINRGCPKPFIFGFCPKNKSSSAAMSHELRPSELEKEEKIGNIQANLDVTTEEDEPAHLDRPLTIHTPLQSTKKLLNMNDANSLSPTGYYSDPCQMKGTSWPQPLNLSPVEMGKSFDQLNKENTSQNTLPRMERYRSVTNKHDDPHDRTTNPEILTEPNVRRAVHSETAPSESGPVPNFKSLQERQVTWMLHQLEEQHLQAMKQQYEQHQRNIQKIQEDMEAEILNQQASFQQKIKTSKNALIKEALGQNKRPPLSLQPNINHPNFNSYDADIDLSDTEDSEDNLSPGMYVKGKNSFTIPLNDNHPTNQANLSSSPVSPRRELFSPLIDHSPLPCHLEASLDPGIITNGRILRGGVYATPFPLSKSTLLLQQTPSLAELSSKDPSPETDADFRSILGEDSKSETQLLQELHQRHNQRLLQQKQRQQLQRSPEHNFVQLTDDQITDPLDLLSINDSRENLREKHAKHLSDLRRYYQKEIKELRDALSNTESVSGQSAYKKLVEENLHLTKKCQEKENELAQQKASDYEEQVQVYQAQLKTYAQRCTDLEKLIGEFKQQLYQETAHNNRKETRLKELETELLKQNSAIEDMMKIREDYLEDSKQKQATIQKLISRYEKLEKEYNITKESLTVAEERYFDSNAEILYVKRENARLDFDNKRLMRENENLRQKIGSFNFYGDQESENLNNASVNNSTSKSPKSTSASSSSTSQRNLASQTRQAEIDLMKEMAGNHLSEAFENKFTSPIMAAEKELRKLRSSKKLLGKPTNSVVDLDFPDGILVDLPLSTAMKTKAAKTNQRQFAKELKSKSNASHPSHPPTMESSKFTGRNKVSFQPKEVNNSHQYDIRLNDVSKLVKDQPSLFVHQDKSNNAGSADKSKESKLGQFHSQTQFEDLYSSLSKVQNQLETSPITVSKTQQKFQVTLETIKQLEDRYDCLQAEKNQLQSALSRIPISGRVDRKARQRKEDLEKKLDTIERELGSVRMSLKRFNVLKSSI